MKLRKGILFLLFFTLSLSVLATHQRAGEIIYRHISGLTYEITVITYTYSISPADRCELEVIWGDGNTGIIPRVNGEPGITPGGFFCAHTGEIVDELIRKNVYQAQHTFASAGDYLISVEDPNRNYGVINIPNSVNIPLYVDTRLLINPFVGTNNSPQLLLPPIDKGCVGHPFLHNPGAYDPDGDSLAYELVACRGASGLEIPGYTLPQSSKSFTINEFTGDIIWDSPVMQGEYNIAFLIKEYRNGQQIGFVTRDMQIIISSCDNEAPTINLPADTCVMAGEQLRFTVTASDVDNDIINLTGYGGPMLVNDSPAEFPEAEGTGYVEAQFQWNTNCSHIQKAPWQVFFKAIDDSEPINLSDIKSMNITVIGPPPQINDIQAVGNSITLEWLPYECDNASKLAIYRRAGSYPYNYGPCDTGLPENSGYVKIAETDADGVARYTDNNNGVGLVHGIEYCYRMTALFPGGAESYVSEEFCTALKKDMPVITHASILSTSQTNGTSQVMWSMPVEIDYDLTPGPFKYLIHRIDLETNTDILVDSLSNLTDTIFDDSQLNTQTIQYAYYLEFINDTPGNRFIIGNTSIAQTPFLSITPTDKQLTLSWSASTPWVNESWDIFRFNEVSAQWDSIANVTGSSYDDKELINGEEYCYFVRARGSYNTAGIISPLLNLSQENCDIPVDNIPPCPVVLFSYTDCDNVENHLFWTNPETTCGTQVSSYTLYATPDQLTDFIPVDSLFSAMDTTYIHSFGNAITGCYYVVAVDESGNRSEPSNILCIPHNTCSVYQLPNVFTPNSDGYNDYFKPFPYTSIEAIKAEIFNRYGQVVFQTTDPEINWDGRNQITGGDCSEGVYFFTIKLQEITLQGIMERTVTGMVHLLRE